MSIATRRDGRLLTAGERVVVARLLSAPRAVQALVARLAARRASVFWVTELDYADVPDIAAACRAAVGLGLAWPAAALPTRWLAEARRLPELRAACRALGRPRSGRKAELVARLVDTDARPYLVGAGIWLRHRALWRRLARLYLYDHHGDLSKLVVARLGHVTPVDYAPTLGGGLFPRRRDLRDYERALVRRATVDASALADAAPAALARFEAARPAPSWRARFSARRFDEALVHAAAREQERAGALGTATSWYRRLLAAAPRTPGAHAARLARCLARDGDAGAGAGLCAEWAERVPRADAVALERTGRRLARKGRVGWTPLPPLRAPRERTVAMVRLAGAGPRPAWQTPHGPRDVEAGVVDLLAGHGRVALYGEGAPWSSLFGVLFRDALFAPVPGMLPAPLLSRPLDLGTPGFRARRAALVAAALSDIRAGGAATRVAAVVDRFGQEDIAGVHWAAFSPEVLAALASSVPGPALAAVMDAFVDDWQGARRGMPDLCVLPGAPARLAGAHPSRLPAEVMFVEVKGPGDTVRDDQAVWMDRLLAAGVPTEVWRVEAASTSSTEPPG